MGQTESEKGDSLLTFSEYEEAPESKDRLKELAQYSRAHVLTCSRARAYDIT